MVTNIANSFMREHDFFLDPIKSLSDNYVNGMDAMVMQSDQDADRVIAAFEVAIGNGFHPEEVEQDIYQQLGVNPADFTRYDKEKISRKVNEIWEAHQGGFYA